MPRKKKTKKRRRKIQVRPGWLVVDVSMAAGGVHYERSYDDPTPINRGKGIKTELYTTKTVDHVEAVAALDALKKQADYACRKYCARTAFGWYADEVSLRALRKEISALKEKAQMLNESAAKVGSERRVHIGIVAGELDVANADTAREIARTIRVVLADVLVALRSGEVKQILDEKSGEVLCKNRLHAPLLRCRNLGNLAVGLAGAAVDAALARIPEAKREIIELLGEGEDPADAGVSVDLEAIENAITWFEEDEIGPAVHSQDPISRALKL